MAIRSAPHTPLALEVFMFTPLIFKPLYRQYLWGGRRFQCLLGRELEQPGPYAESWEIVDHGSDQSIVRYGPLAGKSLGELMREDPQGLAGISTPSTFPLLFKFLDAHKVLSVQVHPDDEAASQRTPPDRGKNEAWYVVEAEPGSKIYAGLRDGVDEPSLRKAISAGTCEEVLHVIEPKAGDCIFIPAGTVHAIGAGLVIAEIQQSSDITFRLFDWNRVDKNNIPRALHLDEGIEATRFLGPVTLAPKKPTIDPAVRRLVECSYFFFDEVRPNSAWMTAGNCCEIIAVLSGELKLPPDWNLPTLQKGDCVLFPAELQPQSLSCQRDDHENPHLLRITVPPPRETVEKTIKYVENI
jgi:mannose-6-phosphate isomerase